MGFKRVADDLDDLKLDIPNALSHFSTLCDMCVAQTFMSEETYDKVFNKMFPFSDFAVARFLYLLG